MRKDLGWEGKMLVRRDILTIERMVTHNGERYLIDIFFKNSYVDGVKITSQDELDDWDNMLGISSAVAGVKNGEL